MLGRSDLEVWTPQFPLTGSRPRVDVQLTFEKSDADELRLLHEWLTLEPELRGKVKKNQPQSTQEMGVLGEALAVAVGSGGALSVLFTSLKVWFAQPRRSDVRIELETGDGRKVMLDARRVARPEELVREVLRDSEVE